MISGVWFEMMNSAPQRRPSAAERSLSDFSTNNRTPFRDGRASANSEMESRSRDRSAHSYISVKRDDQVIKPRPTQTRSDTATSVICSSNQVLKSRMPIEGGKVTSAARDRDVKNYASLGNDQKIQISKPEYPTAVSTSTSTSTSTSSSRTSEKEKEIAEENSKASVPHHVANNYRNQREYNDAVDSIQHQKQKQRPDASLPPRPRNKLRKERKGMRDGSEGCGRGCEGGKGPGLVMP